MTPICNKGMAIGARQVAVIGEGTGLVGEC